MFWLLYRSKATGAIQCQPTRTNEIDLENIKVYWGWGGHNNTITHFVVLYAVQYGVRDDIIAGNAQSSVDTVLGGTINI